MAFNSFKEPLANAAKCSVFGSPRKSPPRQSMHSKSRALDALNDLWAEEFVRHNSKPAPASAVPRGNSTLTAPENPQVIKSRALPPKPKGKAKSIEEPGSRAIKSSSLSEKSRQASFQDFRGAQEASQSGNNFITRSTGLKTRKSTEQGMEEAIRALPVFSYKNARPAPVVVYTRHEEEANDLVGSLHGPVGFDMEWKLFFGRDRRLIERRTALVQLCDNNMIMLIQVSAMKRFPEKVKVTAKVRIPVWMSDDSKDVIESAAIPKMGANIKNDGQKLYRDFGILPRNLVELGRLARAADPEFPISRSIVALRKMVAIYTGKHLLKGSERTSDWETRLSPEQCNYAANDVYSSLLVYNRLMVIANEQGRTLDTRLYTSDLTQEEDRKISALTNSTEVRPSSGSTTIPGAGNSDISPVSMDVLGKPYTCPRPQHLRAYKMWHEKDLPLGVICANLRTKEQPLKESTVISYVIGALQADPRLPFSLERLKTLVQLEASSWARHRDWIMRTSALPTLPKEGSTSQQI
ncbi:ribonuclease H-like protein [Punctularia strigosozonata HHB-11173 SS5]|uniref:ribonuclease H-like protein n=1 Tax=Punctularia strigosozonata (strain HHB-11173) TaxID=741275 RepID=UPI0004416690|nr:ribonuclease H-like protein [Punctularia strigosozonata HHB-11173 SS5]EIN14444.1 ribonuclease H-like protein [Punctularia strigosozonata HHB-11173 SS5]